MTEKILLGGMTVSGLLLKYRILFPFLTIMLFSSSLHAKKTIDPDNPIDTKEFFYNAQTFLKVGLGIANPPKEFDNPSYTIGGYDIFAEISPGLNLLKPFRVKGAITLQPYVRGIYKSFYSERAYAVNATTMAGSGGLALYFAQTLYFQFGMNYSTYEAQITTAPGTLYSVNFFRSSEGTGRVLNIGYQWFFVRKSNPQKPFLFFVEASIIGEQHTTDSYLLTSGDYSTNIVLSGIDINLGVGMVF